MSLPYLSLSFFSFFFFIVVVPVFFAKWSGIIQIILHSVSFSIWMYQVASLKAVQPYVYFLILFSLFTCRSKRRKKICLWRRVYFLLLRQMKILYAKCSMFTANKQYHTLLTCVRTAPSSLHPCAALALETFCPTCMRLQAWDGDCFLCPSEYVEVRTKKQRFSIWFYFLCFDFLKTTFEQDLTFVLQCGVIRILW